MNSNQVSVASNSYRDYLATVSHELQTPLTNVRGFLDLISMGVYRDSPDLMCAQAVQIKKSIDDLMLMISEFLHVDIISSGKVPLHFSWIEPAELANDAMAHIKYVALTLGVNLTVVVNSNIVFADRGRLMQVLINLLANAIRATAQGGSVVLSIDETRDRWNFSIVDSGHGIQSERLHKLISDCAENASLRSICRQAGLGLTISRALVEAHGGRISVRSEAGAGTTFQFYIPRIMP